MRLSLFVIGLVAALQAPTSSQSGIAPRRSQECLVKHCGALRACMKVTLITNSTFAISFACKQTPFDWLCCPRSTNCNALCEHGLCRNFQNATVESKNNFIDIQIHDSQLAGNHAVGRFACAETGGACGRQNTCTFRINVGKYRLNASAVEPLDENDEELPEPELAPRPTPTPVRALPTQCPPCHRLECLRDDCSCVLFCRCPEQCHAGVCAADVNVCTLCTKHTDCLRGSSCDTLRGPGQFEFIICELP